MTKGLRTHLRDLPRAERRIFLVTAVAVSLPFALAAIAAQADGWYPVGDDAVILTAARQVASSHPPLVGEVTSSQKYGVSSQHPGPLAFYVYAPFVALTGGTTGLLLGAASVAATSMILIGYVTLRTAGLRCALAAWIIVLATGLSVGGSAYLYRPFKTNLVMLPLMLFLFLTWALISGQLAFLPLWVLAGSLAASATVQNLVPVGCIAVLTGVVIALDRGRAPPDATPAVGHRRVRGHLARLAPATVRGRATLAAGAVLGLAAWSGPIYEAATTDGGNVRQLVRVSRATGGEVGFRSAAADTARALAFSPAPTRSERVGTAGPDLVIGSAVGILGLVVVALAWQRLGRPERRLCVLAAAGLAAALVSVATFPSDDGFGFVRLLALSVAAGFCWFAVVGVIAALGRVRPSVADAPSRGLVLLAGATGILSVAVAVPLPLDEAQEYVPWTYRAAPALAARTEPELEGDGRWLLRPIGPRSVRLVMAGIAATLEESDHKTDLGRPPGLGARVGIPVTSVAGQLLLVPSFAPAPYGPWTPVATYRPDDRDAIEADAVAEAAAEFVRTSGATPTPVFEQAVPQLLCPDLAFQERPCPAADALPAGTGLLARLPAWIIAVALIEHHDETMPFRLFDVAELPPDLLDRLRRSWVDIPLTVYRHEGPLG